MRSQMAESSSPALPGDVEWLPGPGGTRALRIHPAAGDPPTLILRLAGGGERRIERARPSSRSRAELDWTAAWLQWPDGTRVALPLPHGPHAEVIQLRPRRFARTEPAPPPDAPRRRARPPRRRAPDGAVAERVRGAGGARSGHAARVRRAGGPRDAGGT